MSLKGEIMELSKVKKLEDLTNSQWYALAVKLGGLDSVIGLLREDLRVEIQEAERLFFDFHGRCIPRNITANVHDANRDFRLDQPEMTKKSGYINRFMRLCECLGINNITGISTEGFKEETERLLDLIRGNAQISNILNGVWLPVILPQLTNDDIGQTLELYLEAVDKSYAKALSDRTFINNRKGDLADKVKVVPGSRHDQLIERIKQEPVIGIHFPTPLQGFSINAQREQVSVLPKGFTLSGMDTPITMTMYPDILARDWQTPGLDMAALSWQSTDYSLYFWADDDGLDFDYTDSLASADDDVSGGLLFVG